MQRRDAHDDPELILATLLEVLAEYPDADVRCMQPTSDACAPLPEVLVGPVGERLRDNRLIGMVAHEDRVPTIASWSSARTHGMSTCAIELTLGPRLGIHTIFSFDLRQSHGAMLSVVVAGDMTDGTEVAAPAAPEIRPRRLEMRLGESGVLLSCGPEVEAMFGHAETDLVGQSAIDLMHADDQELAVGQWIELLAEPGAQRQIRAQFERGDGSWFWLEVTFENRLAAEGCVLVDLLDVNEEMEALSALRKRERVLARLTEALPSGVAQIDGRVVEFANERWAEITGVAPRTVDDLFFGIAAEDETALRNALHAVGSRHIDLDIEVTYLRPEGPRRCQMSLRSVAAESAAAEQSMIASLVDITETWEYNKRLAAQAARDHLTGIANRMALLATLEQALDNGRRSGTNTAVMFFDLNDFKEVNDNHGHSIGDAVLQNVARAIRGELRLHDTVGRVGGDEFVVVCPAVADVWVAEQIAQRVQAAISRPMTIEGETVQIGVSCGITVTMTRLETAEELIAEADVAMYAHKEQEPGGIQETAVMFGPQLVDRKAAQATRVNALRSAVRDASLELHYQPMLNLNTGSIFGYESLVRWWSEGSLEPPMAFLPLAEQEGIISEIGQWVLRQVAELGASLLHKIPPQRISINVSSLQLSDPAFPAAVSEVLAATGLPAERLLIEMAESVIVESGPGLADTLGRLADIGVLMVIDDFGTGHAALKFLRNLPVSGLKIDPSFVQDIFDSRTDAIVRSIIGLGRSLDLLVIAEGIETADQAERLRKLGVDYGQGYYYARPAPFDEVQIAADAFPLAPVTKA